MSTLIWIPARGGSRRIPGKNLAPVGGASLLARAVWAGRRLARGVEGEVRVVVDTDSESLAEEARGHGARVPFLREARVAGDAAASEDTLTRCLERLDGAGFRAEAIVVLQPTSPLRSRAHMEACLARFAAGAPSVVSVRAADVEVAAALTLDEDGTVRTKGTEVGPPAWVPSGAFYAVRRDRLRAAGRILVPGETVAVPGSDPGMLDVDDPWQLELAQGWAGRDAAAGTVSVIAEAGVNHDGDLDTALALIRAAAEAGADWVKFQTFDPGRLVAGSAPRADYQARNTGSSDAQIEMLRALVLPEEWHPVLRARCRELGIGFLSSPFDEASADFLAELGLDRLKIPSGEITNLPFLEHVARLGLPVLLSTGMSTLGEVMDAVERLEVGGVEDLTVLHCVSDYPAAPAHANLRAVETLRSVLGLPAGWSDHTPGWHMAVAAAARGAAVIEKHLTLDRERPGPDHAASLEPHEFRAMVRAIRDVEVGLGDGHKRPQPPEEAIARVARKSLCLARDRDRGSVLQADDLVALRPGTGIPPSRRTELVGRTLNRDLPAGSVLREDHLGGPA